MSPLSQEAIDELKAIHKKQTGKDLTDDEAWAMGHRLARLFKILTTEAGSDRGTPPGDRHASREPRRHLRR